MINLDIEEEEKLEM